MGKVSAGLVLVLEVEALAGTAMATGYDHTLCCSTVTGACSETCAAPATNEWIVALPVTGSTNPSQTLAVQNSEPPGGFNGICAAPPAHCDLGETTTCFPVLPQFCVEVPPTGVFYSNGNSTLETSSANPELSTLQSVESCAPMVPFMGIMVCPTGYSQLGANSCCIVAPSGIVGGQITVSGGIAGASALDPPDVLSVPTPIVKLGGSSLINQTQFIVVTGAEANQPVTWTVTDPTGSQTTTTTGATSGTGSATLPLTNSIFGTWSVSVSVDGQAGSQVVSYVVTIAAAVPAVPTIALICLGALLLLFGYRRARSTALLLLLAAVTSSCGAPASGVTSGLRSQDAGQTDAAHVDAAPEVNWGGAPNALCCELPADAGVSLTDSCSLLSHGPNPADAAGLGVAEACFPPHDGGTYGRWTCGADPGGALCSNDGFSCAVGSACILTDVNCVGTVQPCFFP